MRDSLGAGDVLLTRPVRYWRWSDLACQTLESD
jgi:hypothetical protein